MKQSGWRKPTPGLGIAEQFAQAGEQIAVPKNRAFAAVKRVGAHIGLRASDVMLLDTLGAFTKPQDWEQGRRPIIWASNAYLMEQTGFSLSALKRHARRLAEVGVISFKDSPNGKRWGRRDADDVIIEAYGFDLSPLSARAKEFERLHSEIKAEREVCQRLKRQITISRRMIRARLEVALSDALKGPWAHLGILFEELLSHLPRRNVASEVLESLLNQLKDLQERVDATYLKATGVADPVCKYVQAAQKFDDNAREMNPKEPKYGPHILTTKQLNHVNSKPAKEGELINLGGTPLPQNQADKELEKWAAETKKRRGTALDLSTIMQACPEFTSWARNVGGYLKDWGDLHRVAGQLRQMIGISEHAWNVTQGQLGNQIATEALVLVFEKYCAGEVGSPSGYLRGMVKKAGAGELHLERSFYGRLSAQVG